LCGHKRWHEKFNVHDIAMPESGKFANTFTSLYTDAYSIALSNEVYLRLFEELDFDNYIGFLSYSEIFKYSIDTPFELWHSLK
jgi:hypothetical protein